MGKSTKNGYAVIGQRGNSYQHQKIWEELTVEIGDAILEHKSYQSVTMYVLIQTPINGFLFLLIKGSKFVGAWLVFG